MLGRLAEPTAALLNGIADRYETWRHRGQLVKRVAPAAIKLPKLVELNIGTANISTEGAMSTVLDNARGKLWFIQEHHMLPARLEEKMAVWMRDGHKVP